MGSDDPEGSDNPDDSDNPDGPGGSGHSGKSDDTDPSIIVAPVAEPQWAHVPDEVVIEDPRIDDQDESLPSAKGDRALLDYLLAEGPIFIIEEPQPSYSTQPYELDASCSSDEPDSPEN